MFLLFFLAEIVFIWRLGDELRVNLWWILCMDFEKDADFLYDSCHYLLRAIHGVGYGRYWVPYGKCSVLGIMRIYILTNMVSPHRFGRNSSLVSGLYSPARRLLVREGIRRIIRRLSRASSRVHVDLCLTSIFCIIFN